MKKTLLFLLLLATGCATTNQSNAVTQTANVNPPVYYNGNDEPTANSMNDNAPEYFTGNNEPVASSMNNEK
jgi:hypothetical protein